MNALTIRPRVLHIEESYRVYCTLVTGTRRAILWDTGLGAADLRAVAENPGLPYDVLCSHGHYDHVGGNGHFAEVLLNEKDWHLVENDRERLRPLDAGTDFDLGGLHARTVPLPGHSAGSLGLLLEEERLLLAGDALSPRLLVPADALGTLHDTLTSAMRLPFDTYLTGHAPSEFTKKQIAAHLAHLASLDLSTAHPCRIYDKHYLRSEHRSPDGRSTFFILTD